MLRLLVLLLVLLNAVYFAWSHQMLRAYDFAPNTQREPQRVAQQLRPELVGVLSGDEARGAEGAARQPECLLAGPFDDAQAARLRQAAESGLPASTWLLEAIALPARWIVYMGKYPDAQTLAKKRIELSALNVRFEPISNTALDHGLSLGAFESEERARTALASLTQRGVHSATVVLERAEQRGTVLKLPAVDDALRARLEEFKPVLGAVSLRPCA
ncbi:MAG: SPOR domain-containing protein [Burkholderiaceae bacterium]